MQRIELDFVRRRPASRWAGRVLLAVALGMAGDLALTYVQLQRDVRSNEALLARAQPAKRVQPVSKEEIALAKDTGERLALPAIEPDTKSGTVTISGDSKDYLAALTYVLNLSRADTLSHVQLVRHEVKKNDPQHPVAFSIQAAWK